MKTLEISNLEIINGGGICRAGTVAGAVVTAAGVASHYGWIAISPWGAGFLMGAGVALVAASLYCEFR